MWAGRTIADVAEQADALRSGRSGGNPVGVRISPSAPGQDSSWNRCPRTLTCEDTHRKEERMAADPLDGLEESPSCTEQGCPVKAGETRSRVDSPDWRVARRESNSNQTRGFRPGGLKRAILPAAISDSTVCRLLAKVGSREQLRRRRRNQPSPVERDGHHEQNSAYSFSFALSTYGAFSSFGRALVCGTGGGGFEPRKAPHHPSRRTVSNRLSFVR